MQIEKLKAALKEVGVYPAYGYELRNAPTIKAVIRIDDDAAIILRNGKRILRTNVNGFRVDTVVGLANDDPRTVAENAKKALKAAMTVHGLMKLMKATVFLAGRGISGETATEILAASPTATTGVLIKVDPTTVTAEVIGHGYRIELPTSAPAYAIVFGLRGRLKAVENRSR